MRERRFRKVVIDTSVQIDYRFIAWADPALSNGQIEKIVNENMDISEIIEAGDADLTCTVGELKGYGQANDVVLRDRIVPISELRDKATDELIVPTDDESVPAYGRDELTGAEYQELVEKRGQQRLPF